MPIQPGHHLTEVLGVAVQAIDCGGAVARWSETVLQLVEPAHDEGGRTMSASKAGAILQRSQARVPLSADSELVLEYHAPGARAAQRFHVTAVQPGATGQLRVLSEGARTQCKAAGRGAPAEGAGCCAPAAAAPAGHRTQRCCA